MDYQILLITNKKDITTDFVVRELKKTHVRFYRFNTEDLWTTVSFSYTNDSNGIEAYLKNHITNEIINLNSIKSVYFRRPIIPMNYVEGLSSGEFEFILRENNRVLEGIYKILNNSFWVSNVSRIKEAENKIWQLNIAKELCFKIPESLISNCLLSISNFFKNSQDTVVKTLAGGLVEEDEIKNSVIFTSKVDRLPFKDELDGSFVFMQSEIKKKADVRVIVVGNKCFAVTIDSQKNPDSLVDWRRTDKPLKHTPFELPKEIELKCQKLVSKLGLQFGAIDFILTENDDYFFLEINPNGQWAWIENLTQLPIAQEIVKLLLSKCHA